MAQDDQQPQAPKEGQPQEPQELAAQAAPSNAPEDTGQASKVPSKPSKLEGKSPDELATMYMELEKKLGQQSQELGQSRDAMDKMSIVTQAIYSDPDTLKQVERSIQKMYGVAEDQPTNGKAQPQFDDTRRAVENGIIDTFEYKYGVTELPAEEKKTMHVKIGNALAEMLDPGGTKSYQQIMSDIPLDRLPRYLENAYFLANKDEISERSRTQGQISALQNNMATIGSIPSSSIRSEDVQLTAAERETAQKMGIPEDRYLKNKKEIQARDY